jgi:hypothetical protein
MPVLLTMSRRLPTSDAYDVWCAIEGASSGLPDQKKMSNLAKTLEDAYDAIREEWWGLAHRLNVCDSSAELSQVASCNSSVSDFGAMLAWTQLYLNWDQAGKIVLVVCDDPWLFRHFLTLGGTVHGAVPKRWGLEIRLAIRGFAARVRYALKVMAARTYLRCDVQLCPKDSLSIVSYGHPASSPGGKDAYFGDLMSWTPHLVRMLHTDCTVRRAVALSAAGRTFSLHAWGSLWFALTVPFRVWRMTIKKKKEPMWWLIHRAAVLERGTGQSASIAWQNHCQSRWLKAQKPHFIMWPWENHGWERALVRAANIAGVKSAGYQHTVVGRRHWVHALTSNRDGLKSLPDRIICNGPIWVDALANYGIPYERMEIGGTLRFSSPKPLKRDPKGPIFVALPFAHAIAEQMMNEVERMANKGDFRFIVRDHPMNPYPLRQSPGINRAEKPLPDVGGIAAVIYAATTVGLEALIGGLPVVRFVPEGNASVDVIPESLDVPAAAAQHLNESLCTVVEAELNTPTSDEFFRSPDKAYWKQLLSTERSGC